MLDRNGFYCSRAQSHIVISYACRACVRAGAELTDCDTPLWTTAVNTQRVKRPEAPSPVRGRPSSLAYINVGGNVSRGGKKNKNPRNLYNAISYARTLLAIESLLFTGRLTVRCRVCARTEARHRAAVLREYKNHIVIHYSRRSARENAKGMCGIFFFFGLPLIFFLRAIPLRQSGR